MKNEPIRVPEPETSQAEAAESELTEMAGLPPSQRAARASSHARGSVEEDAADTTHIGPYRLLELLGQGGMARVHLAVREDDYRQRVALKRVFGPVDRPQLHARFVNERQILADLEHPGI